MVVCKGVAAGDNAIQPCQMHTGQFLPRLYSTGKVSFEDILVEDCTIRRAMNPKSIVGKNVEACHMIAAERASSLPIP